MWGVVLVVGILIFVGLLWCFCKCYKHNNPEGLSQASLLEKAADKLKAMSSGPGGAIEV